jgi:hypothetical protein
MARDLPMVGLFNALEHRHAMAWCRRYGQTQSGMVRMAVLTLTGWTGEHAAQCAEQPRPRASVLPEPSKKLPRTFKGGTN